MQHPLVLFIIGFFGVGLLVAVYMVIMGALYGAVPKTADGGANWTGAQQTAQSVINNSQDLFTNFTSQFGTIGTVGGVLILLVLLAAAGIGAYAVYQKSRR